VVRVLADILLATDGDDLSALALLDLSAAIDTVDHMHLRRPQCSYGLGGVVLDWHSTYLVGRCQFNRTSSYVSTPAFVVSGFPRGSILGPIVFFSIVLR
jgi:hypothetical protein